MVKVIGITRPLLIDAHGNQAVLKLVVRFGTWHVVECALGVPWIKATRIGIFPRRWILRFRDYVVNLESDNEKCCDQGPKTVQDRYILEQGDNSALSK